MDMLRCEKISLRDQVESLWRTVHALKDGDRGRDRTPSSDETVPMRDSPVSRHSRDCRRCSSRRRDLAADDVTRETGARNLSPIYRPSLGGARKRLKDVLPLLTRIDRSGRIIADGCIREWKVRQRVPPHCTGFKGCVAPSCREGVPLSCFEDCSCFVKMCEDGEQIRSAEFNLEIVTVSESNHVPDGDRWLASTDTPPSAAVIWQWSRSRMPCSPRWRSTRFAAVDCYFPPNLSDDEFLRDLRELKVRLHEPLEILAWALRCLARRNLRKAIIQSKVKLWAELVDNPDRDPWEMPYRVVFKKLHAGGASIVEVLPPETMGDIVETLFPMDCSPPGTYVPFVWQDDLAVTVEEILEAGLKVKSGKAPGPDSVAGGVIRSTMGILPRCELDASSCLRGNTSRAIGGLVLIKKPAKSDLSPSSYRPICLLSEAGKLFERVIVRRLGVADGQFGFRQHCSTINVIWLRLRLWPSLLRKYWTTLLFGTETWAVVSIGSAVKYLGLILDSRWTFRDHFRLLLPIAWGMAMSLARLTAIIGDLGERRRRLYATVVMSVVLYGTPIWAQTITGNLRDVRRL
ncbi:RTJK polymerase, partial [Pseudoatta argentina]